jgi:hypothetical protein
LTLAALFHVYILYALKAMPHKTAAQFEMVLHTAFRYNDEAWLLSIAVLVSAIVWRRSSKYLATGLALGLGIWLLLMWTWIAISQD